MPLNAAGYVDHVLSGKRAGALRPLVDPETSFPIVTPDIWERIRQGCACGDCGACKGFADIRKLPSDDPNRDRGRAASNARPLGFSSTSAALAWYVSVIEDGAPQRSLGAILDLICKTGVSIQGSGDNVTDDRMFQRAVRLRRIERALGELYQPPHTFGASREACLRVLFGRLVGEPVTIKQRAARVPMTPDELERATGITPHAIADIIREGNRRIMGSLRGRV